MYANSCCTNASVAGSAAAGSAAGQSSGCTLIDGVGAGHAAAETNNINAAAENAGQDDTKLSLTPPLSRPWDVEPPAPRRTPPVRRLNLIYECAITICNICTFNQRDPARNNAMPAYEKAAYRITGKNVSAFKWYWSEHRRCQVTPPPSACSACSTGWWSPPI